MVKKIKVIISIILVIIILSVSVQAENELINTSDLDQFVQQEKVEKDKYQYSKETNKKNAKTFNVKDNKDNVDSLIVRLENIDNLENMDIENIQGEYQDYDAISVEIPEGKSKDEMVEELEKIPGVESVENEYIGTTSYIPQDQYYQSSQWNLKKINMEGAWDITKGSNNTIIAVIDTGVGAQSDLNNVLIKGASILTGNIQEDSYPGEYSYDGGAKDINAQDTFGFPIFPHGTAVAGVIASTMNSNGIAGIIPNAKIMPIKVFEDSKGYCSLLDVALAIRWATDHGADIINLSLGGASAPNELEDAVNYAYYKGATIVAASGNEGTDVSNYPAIYENVISVGSSSSNDSTSEFSNIGMELDIIAPGENILAPYIGERLNTDFVNMSGTSFSSPTVAGIAGLINSKYPNLSNEKIQQILYTSAKDTTDVQGWDGESGFGRVDALGALRLAGDNSIWDSDNSINTARTLSKSSINNTLYPARDKDIYKINITKPGNLKVSVDSLGDFDLVIVLTDSTGNVIDYMDEGRSGERELLSTYITNASDYYIWVTDYYGDFSKTATYNIDINPIKIGEINRYAGVDKWETATMISSNGWGQSDNVILAYGNNFPDALAGAPLAAKLNSPILLTNKDSIPTATMNEIQRLNPKTIYLLGGHLVISTALEYSLRNEGYEVIRVAGADKYKTAVEIAKELTRTDNMFDTVVVAYGDNFPDALSIGGFAGEMGWPLLFTGNKTLNADTKKAIKDWDIQKVIIVGGTLVVSSSTEKELKDMGIEVERIAGATLWETSVKIIQRFKKNTDGVIVTTGQNYPDALTGGALAYKYSYPVLLVKKTEASSKILDYITTSGADRAIILGGHLAIEDKVVNQVRNQLSK